MWIMETKVSEIRKRKYSFHESQRKANWFRNETQHLKDIDSKS